MARARNIKPGLFKNEVLGTADPLYTILFEGLWTLADREGRLEDRPLRIKAEVLPYRDGINLDAMLDWLASHGFIIRYKHGENRYIQIVNFAKHQNPHKNEQASEIPEYSESCTSTEKIGTRTEDSGSTRADSLSSDSLSSDSLNPDSRKNRKSRAIAISLPDWIPLEAWNGFVAMRKAIKKPLTENAIALAIDKLGELWRSGHDPKAVLEQSTLNSWQGLFPVKAEYRAGAPPGGGFESTKDRERREVLEGIFGSKGNDDRTIDITPAGPDKLG